MANNSKSTETARVLAGYEALQKPWSLTFFNTIQASTVER